VPSAEDIVGGISAIVWAFTLLPCVKYGSLNAPVRHRSLRTDSSVPPRGGHLQVIIALAFGSGEGEGGPFALFLRMFPRRNGLDSQDEDRQLTRYSTNDVQGAVGADGGRSGKLMKFRWPLQVMVRSFGFVPRRSLPSILT
jgi:KUP system potassium uptake protein